jgi:hypothetical protein
MYGLVTNGGIPVHAKFSQRTYDRQVWETDYITQPSAYGFIVTEVTSESSSIRWLFKDDVTVEWDGNIMKCQWNTKNGQNVRI